MKKTLLILLTLSILFTFSGCYARASWYPSLSWCESQYDEEWIEGKTAEEIQEKYGTMDSFRLADDGNGYEGRYYLTDDTADGEGGIIKGGYSLIIYFDENKTAIDSCIDERHPN